MSSGDGEGLLDLLDELRGRAVTIVPHRDADPDALASAAMLDLILKDAGLESGIYMPSSNRFTRDLAPMVIGRRFDGIQGDAVAVVDTSAPNMLPVPAEELSGMDIHVLDHHVDNGDWDHAKTRIIRKRPSNVEVILEIMEEAGMDPEKILDRDTALMGLIGIYFDSGGFRFASPDTFRHVHSLMDAHDLDMKEISRYTRVQHGRSERIAVLRSYQRLRYRENGGWFIGTSVVGAFEATAARKMVDSGLDAAFVGSADKRNNVRVACRASDGYVDGGGDLTRVIEVVKRSFGTDGGGHPGAAGLTGVCDLEALLNALADEAVRQMKGISPAGRHK